VKLALSWLTVLPLRVDDVDRKAAGRAITWTPVVGLLLGAFVVGVLELFAMSDVPALVAGFLVVGVIALSTRGMHLDGLADVADGLGCYGPPERALKVMKDGGAGPFGVVTLVVVLGAQAAALPHAHWGVVVLAFATSRAAFGSAACAVCPPHDLRGSVRSSRAHSIRWWSSARGWCSPLRRFRSGGGRSSPSWSPVRSCGRW